jgi:REP element-mobilizing transposase RayT
MLGKALEDLSCKPVCINGTGDHVHILLSLGRECSISKCAMQLKRLSSSWIEKRDPHYRGFHWQNGYGAFSVSQSGVDKVVQYISNQEEHHKRMSFREEFRKFLDLYHIDYDANYLPGYE